MRNNFRDEIADEIARILREDGIVPGELFDATPLEQVGLDSLGFAILIARLEAVFGFDPFTESAIDAYPITFGDFVDVYKGF